jgi:hypothetical protein
VSGVCFYYMCLALHDSPPADTSISTPYLSSQYTACPRRGQRKIWTGILRLILRKSGSQCLLLEESSSEMLAGLRNHRQDRIHYQVKKKTLTFRSSIFKPCYFDQPYSFCTMKVSFNSDNTMMIVSQRWATTS